MKEALNQLPLNIVKIHTPELDCDIDSGSDNPTSVHQDLPPRPDSQLYPDLKSNQYHLPPLIFDRAASDCVYLIPPEHILGH